MIKPKTCRKENKTFCSTQCREGFQFVCWLLMEFTGSTYVREHFPSRGPPVPLCAQSPQTESWFFLKTFMDAQESIPRNRIRQPMKPGGPVRQPYSYSVPSLHILFKNSSTGFLHSIQN